MHHVKLSSDAKQPSGPEQDATVNQPDVGRHFLDHGYTAVPYVNEYEDPGTISYLAHHSAIHLVKTEPLMAKEAVTGYTGLTGRTAMIYLELPEGLVKHVPGGVDDHHITLVYLGKNVSDAAFGEACRRAQAAAAQASPLIGFLAGIETFEPSDGKVPAFVPAYLPGIGRLRAALEDLNASQYRQYRPHVTLAYLAPEDELPEPHPKVDVRFSRLHVKRGDDVVSFPLGHP
jgi:2'-5' RNA ligase